MIRVGAATETEMKESKLRLEDALAATKCSSRRRNHLRWRICIISMPLRKAAENVADLEGDEKTGANIILKALRSTIIPRSQSMQVLKEL